MKTPMQELIEILKENKKRYEDAVNDEDSFIKQISLLDIVIKESEKLLPKERQQKIDDFNIGKFEGVNMAMKEGEQYFNEKYNENS